MIKYQDYLQDRKGNAIPNAYVLVKTTAGVTASLYGNSAGSIVLANPVRTDDDGHYSFYAASAHYDLTITLPEGGTKTVSDVFIGDGLPGGGSGGGGTGNTEWYIVASVATRDGLQAAVDAAIAAGVPGIGYPEVRLIPGMRYVWDDAAPVLVNIVAANVTYRASTSAYTGGLRITCSSMCTFDGTGFTTAKPLIKWVQQSGTNSQHSVIEGVFFTGKIEYTTGIEVSGSFHSIRHCHFNELLNGIVWCTNFNNSGGYIAAGGQTVGFTEQCTGSNLTFRSNCAQPMSYRDDSTEGGRISQRSFRGTGLIGNNVVSSTLPTNCIIKIFTRCLVYMAPMYLDISVPSQQAYATADGVAVFDNNSGYLNCNWYGVLKSEAGPFCVVTVGKTAQVIFSGVILGNGNFWRRGTARIHNTAMTTINEFETPGTNVPIIGEYYTSQDASILNGGGSYTTTWQVRTCMDIVVSLQCPGTFYEGRYALQATFVTGNQLAFSQHGSVIMKAILHERNPTPLGLFSNGGITFSVDINGCFRVDAPGWINTNAVLMIDARQTAQAHTGPDSNTQRFRHDLSYVGRYTAAYVSANVVHVECSEDGGASGRGQTVAYFMHVGYTFYVFDLNPANAGGRLATVVSIIDVGMPEGINLETDITIDATTFGASIATAG